MKKMKKVLAVLLVVCMTFGCMQTGVSAQTGQDRNEGFTVVENLDTESKQNEAENQSEEINASPDDKNKNAENEPEVTRVEWLEVLTTAYGFTVDENNYPDNYFSDITSESEYYYAVMLAAEFGLIDVEAGDPMEPEAAATREFVSHSMNMCMGIQLEENEEGEFTYTFEEAESVTYPDDIQVAVNQNWFVLDGDKFNPEAAVTQTEADALIEIAEEEIASQIIDENYENKYGFADGVLILDEALEIELTEDEEYTIYGTPEIKSGDKIGFVIDDIPFVKKVVSVEADEEKTVVLTESVEMEEAFKELDLEGSRGADLTEVVAVCDDVDMFYVIDGTEEAHYEDGISVQSLTNDEEVNAVRFVKTYDIPDKVRKKYNLADGVSAYIEAVVYNTSEEHKMKLDGESYVAINATIRFTCNVSMDVLKAIGVNNSIELASIAIGGIGRLKVALDLQLEGDISLNIVESLRFGVKYSRKKGFSAISTLHKESFSVVAKVKAKAGVKASIGVDLAIIKGFLYAKVGMQGKVELSAYPDSTDVCLQVNAWLYAAVGYEVSVNYLIGKKSSSKEHSIYNAKNSPVRVAFHYDNGIPVKECAKKGSVTTTGKIQEGVKYYTPADSCYGYNGASWGYDSAGKEYTIFKYDVIEGTNNVCITSYNGNVSALSIPSTLDGYTVTQIGRDVFENRKELVSVTVPDTVTSIGSDAFCNCTNLSYLKLPENENFVTISSSMCSGCKNLRGIEIPDSVTEIGGSAFYECSGLEKVVLSKSLVSMEWSVFYDCDKLTEIEIPKSLDLCRGSSGPFAECSNLKKVTFEKGTTQIASNLFNRCDGLEEIKIPDTVTVIEYYAFNACENLSKVEIPDSVTKIGGEAFSKCENLSKVEIPDSVTEIGGSAFYECSGLEKVVLSKSLVSMEWSVFYDCDKLTEIEIPKSLDLCRGSSGPFAECSNLKKVTFEKGTTQIASNLFNRCDGLEEIKIPDTVTVIEDRAFNECENLSKVEIPDSVTKIGGEAFSKCENLSKAEIPDSVTEIGGSAFYECSGLGKVVLSKSLVSMGWSVFYDCDKLTEIEIPKSLDWCRESSGPFAECSNLKKVTFEKGTTQIASNLFRGCDGLEEIKIPDTVTVIEDRAFNECENLIKVEIPNGVKEIGGYAFSGCISLPEIVLPNSVSGMGTYVFADCTALETVTLPNILQNITQGTFYNCTSLKNITLPDSLIAIRLYAFYNCDALENIKIPESVEIIEGYAFCDCDGLKKIDIPEGVSKVQGGAFENCDVLTSVTLPNTLTSLGDYAFKTCELLTEVRFGTGLKSIGTDAFMDCASLKKIVLPYSMESIGINAFKNDTVLTEIYIPERVTTIDSTAFSYPKKLTIYGVEGSYAEKFAKEKGITFVAAKAVPDAITLNKKEVTVNKYSTIQLNATITPAEYMGAVEWTSADDNIATVDKNGVVKGVSGGQTTITCKAGDVTATTTVNVFVPVSGIYLKKYSAEIEAGQTYEIQVSSISPSDATNTKVTFESEDVTIATVDASGKISGLAIGETNIIVKSEDGYASRTFKIKVNRPTPQLSLNKEKVYLEAGETFELAATISPEMVADQGILYISSDEGVATVDANGKITAVADGTAVITVKTEDGLAEKTCTVTVAAKISLDRENANVLLGDSLKLNVTLEEEIQGVMWISTNTSVAEVSQDGTLTIKAEGTTTIIVTSTDGKYRAECVITVGIPQPEYSLGDVNEDETIDANDALAILKAVAKMAELTETQNKAADVNNDTFIDANDALMILKYVAKMIESFA